MGDSDSKQVKSAKRRPKTSKSTREVSKLVAQKLEIYMNIERRETRFDPSGQGLFRTNSKMQKYDMAYRVLEATKLQPKSPRRKKRKTGDSEEEDNTASDDSDNKDKPICPQLATTTRRVVLQRESERLKAHANNIWQKTPVSQLQVIHRYRPHSKELKSSEERRKYKEFHCTANGNVQGYSRNIGAYLHTDTYAKYYIKEGLDWTYKKESPRLKKLQVEKERKRIRKEEKERRERDDTRSASPRHDDRSRPTTATSHSSAMQYDVQKGSGGTQHIPPSLDLLRDITADSRDSGYKDDSHNQEDNVEVPVDDLYSDDNFDSDNDSELARVTKDYNDDDVSVAESEQRDSGHSSHRRKSSGYSIRSQTPPRESTPLDRHSNNASRSSHHGRTPIESRSPSPRHHGYVSESGRSSRRSKEESVEYLYRADEAETHPRFRSSSRASSARSKTSERQIERPERPTPGSESDEDRRHSVASIHSIRDDNKSDKSYRSDVEKTYTGKDSVQSHESLKELEFHKQNGSRTPSAVSVKSASSSKKERPASRTSSHDTKEVIERPTSRTSSHYAKEVTERPTSRSSSRAQSASSHTSLPDIHSPKDKTPSYKLSEKERPPSTTSKASSIPDYSPRKSSVVSDENELKDARPVLSNSRKSPQPSSPRKGSTTSVKSEGKVSRTSSSSSKSSRPASRESRSLCSPTKDSSSPLEKHEEKESRPNSSSSKKSSRPASRSSEISEKKDTSSLHDATSRLNENMNDKSSSPVTVKERVKQIEEAFQGKQPYLKKVEMDKDSESISSNPSRKDEDRSGSPKPYHRSLSSPLGDKPKEESAVQRYMLQRSMSTVSDDSKEEGGVKGYQRQLSRQDSDIWTRASAVQKFMSRRESQQSLKDRPDSSSSKASGGNQDNFERKGSDSSIKSRVSEPIEEEKAVETTGEPEDRIDGSDTPSDKPSHKETELHKHVTFEKLGNDSDSKHSFSGTDGPAESARPSSSSSVHSKNSETNSSVKDGEDKENNEPAELSVSRNDGQIRPDSGSSKKSDNSLTDVASPMRAGSASSKRSGPYEDGERPESSSSKKSADIGTVDQRPSSVVSSESAASDKSERPPSGSPETSQDRPKSATSEHSTQSIEKTESEDRKSSADYAHGESNRPPSESFTRSQEREEERPLSSSSLPAEKERPSEATDSRQSPLPVTDRDKKESRDELESRKESESDKDHVSSGFTKPRIGSASSRRSRTSSITSSKSLLDVAIKEEVEPLSEHGSEEKEDTGNTQSREENQQEKETDLSNQSKMESAENVKDDEHTQEPSKSKMTPVTDNNDEVNTETIATTKDEVKAGVQTDEKTSVGNTDEENNKRDAAAEEGKTSSDTQPSFAKEPDHTDVHQTNHVQDTGREKEHDGTSEIETTDGNTEEDARKQDDGADNKSPLDDADNDKTTDAKSNADGTETVDGNVDREQNKDKDGEGDESSMKETMSPDIAASGTDADAQPKTDNTVNDAKNADGDATSKTDETGNDADNENGDVKSKSEIVNNPDNVDNDSTTGLKSKTDETGNDGKDNGTEEQSKDKEDNVSKQEDDVSKKEDDVSGNQVNGTTNNSLDVKDVNQKDKDSDTVSIRSYASVVHVTEESDPTLGRSSLSSTGLM